MIFLLARLGSAVVVDLSLFLMRPSRWDVRGRIEGFREVDGRIPSLEAKVRGSFGVSSVQSDNVQ